MEEERGDLSLSPQHPHKKLGMMLRLLLQQETLSPATPQNRVSLCSPSWRHRVPRTFSVDQAGLDFRDLPTSAGIKGLGHRTQLTTSVVVYKSDVDFDASGCWQNNLLPCFI